MAVIASEAPIADIRQNYPPRAAVVSWIFFARVAEPFSR